MDRPIEPAERRSRSRRRYAFAAIALLSLAGGYFSLAAWLTPTVDRSELRIARVETGPIESALQAGGTIVPLDEQLVTSPADARVLAVLHRAGDRVAPGEPILRLDLAALELDRSRVDQQLLLEGNQQRRTQLDTRQKVTDLEAELKRQQLALEFLGSKLRRCEQLASQGLDSQEAVLAARLEVDQSRATVEKLEASLENTRASVQAELEGSELRMGILRRERDLAGAKLERAACASDTGGTITWAVAEPGAQVRAGDVVARLSDLSAYQVRATLSDLHAAKIEAGLPARVKLDGAWLTGRVTSVLPAVENGTVVFYVGLDDPAHAGLRSSRRADVEVVVDRRERALVVRRGPGIPGPGAQELFVVTGDRAERRPVTVGLVNLDWCELVSGAGEGQEVVVSDTAAWKSVRSLRLRGTPARNSTEPPGRTG